jgi:putative transcriptional regulator
MTRNLKAAAILIALSVAGSASAQSPEKGKLLVATEAMQDPAFKETVVLLLHHDGNGSIDVDINRPTWLEPKDVEPEIGEIEGYDGNVWRGGSLAPTQLIFLVRNPPAGAFDAPPILNRIYASGNLEVLPELAAASGDDSGLRVYAGHSEWAAGQIEQEIAAGRWVVVEGTDERIFAPEAAELWRRTLEGGSELLVEKREPARPAMSAASARGGD